MAFEPLQTDEKLDQSVKAERDMDTQMLFGCSSFVFASILVYLLVIIPHLIFTDVYRLATLGLCLAIGLGPALIFGAVASRRMGLPGACGFVGGGMAAAIFLFLRLREVEIARNSPRDLPQPEYPTMLVWIVPTAWVLVALLVALVFLPKKELP